MSEYITTSEELTSVADAIRNRGGTSATLIFPDGFISAITEIQNLHDMYIEHSWSGSTFDDSHVTMIGEYAFQSYINLLSVNCPVCSYVASDAFDRCSNLTTISFPSCTSIGWYAFAYCSNLSTASFPACTYIDRYAFYNNRKLEKIYFMASTYVLLSSVNVFGYTPMSDSSYLSRFGSIYVPASMLATYKTQANWSVYSSRLVGV